LAKVVLAILFGQIRHEFQQIIQTIINHTHGTRRKAGIAAAVFFMGAFKDNNRSTLICGRQGRAQSSVPGTYDNYVCISHVAFLANFLWLLKPDRVAWANPCWKKIKRGMLEVCFPICGFFTPLFTALTENTPVLYALSAATLFAISVQFTHLGLKHGEPMAGSTIHITTTAVIYWAMAPFYLDPAWFLTSATLIFAFVGLFRPFVSSNLSINGVRILGPTLSSALASTSPLWGAFFGIVFLSEVATLPVALGIGAIAGGLLSQTLRRQDKQVSNWPLWALLLPLGAAFFRALGHLFVKLGYEDVSSPYYAALVSSTVSCILAIGFFKGRGHRFNPRSKGMGWFLLAGILNAIAALAINAALKDGKIIEVIPIASVTPVIALLLTIFVFRREQITLSKVITVALVFSGVILVTVGA
jgi:drug/metabolite transporter, DME family